MIAKLFQNAFLEIFNGMKIGILIVKRGARWNESFHGMMEFGIG